MIDVAIASIYNFASGVQELRPLEDIPENSHQCIFRKLATPREDYNLI
jgi:hypothetical protein